MNEEDRAPRRSEPLKPERPPIVPDLSRSWPTPIEAGLTARLGWVHPETGAEMSWRDYALTAETVLRMRPKDKRPQRHARPGPR
jgi:hypothetical protein